MITPEQIQDAADKEYVGTKDTSYHKAFIKGANFVNNEVYTKKQVQDILWEARHFYNLPENEHTPYRYLRLRFKKYIENILKNHGVEPGGE